MNDAAWKRRLNWAAWVSCLMTAAAAVAGGDVKVNQDVGNSPQNETSITINRGWPGNVVVGYNDVPGTANGLGIGYSFNQGATWKDSQTASVWGIDADPSLASDLMGNLFAGMISYASSGPLIFPSNGIYVSRSTDGGATWGIPTMVDQCLAGAVPAYMTDKDYVATDTYVGSPYQNRLYITWQRDNANGVNADIYAAWSNDQAATFNYATGAPTGRISDLPSVPGAALLRSSNANGAVPAVDRNGNVYVAWQDAPLCMQSVGEIFVDKSSDGGQTWGTDVAAVRYNTCARWPNGGASFQVRSFPSIAASPACSDVYVVYSTDPDRQNETSIESDTPGASDSQTPQIACAGSNVYAVWRDGRNNASYGDVYFNRSTDNGVTWGTDVRVNTGVAAGSAFVEKPHIAAVSNDVYVIWEDRRSGNADIYFNVSTDNGATWLASSVRLDTGTAPGAVFSQNAQIAADASGIYVVWEETPVGDSDIYCNYSHDNGTTWLGSALRIDHAAAGVYSFAPQIASFNPNYVGVTWYDNRNGNVHIYFNFSDDGGPTWRSASDWQIDTGSGPALNPRICIALPSVYIAWEDSRNGLKDIYFNYSAGNGYNFQITDARLDVGDTAGASASDELDLTCDGCNVYAVWADARNGQKDIYYNVSKNCGISWQGSDFRVDTDYIPGSNASASPRVSANANFVYVAYTDYRHGKPDIYFRWSVDYGITSWYACDVRLDAGDLAGTNVSITPVLVNTGSNVYAAWADSRNGNADIYFNASANNGARWRDGPDFGDIMLVRSSDGGVTWGTPVRVNNDAGTNGQFQPWIKVKPNGVIDVVWYDRRNDTTNDSFVEVYMGTSNDRGLTFTNSVVSDVVMRPGPAPMIWPWPWMGEYMGIDVDATDAYIAWTDTRTPFDLDIYFDRFVNPVTTGAGGDAPAPHATYLGQNVPNPFNPVTVISFGLAQRGDVSLCVYDVAGRLVRVIVNGVLPAGNYQQQWDGRDGTGVAVASGVYFYRLVTPGFDEARRMVLLK